MGGLVAEEWLALSEPSVGAVADGDDPLLSSAAFQQVKPGF